MKDNARQRSPLGPQLVPSTTTQSGAGSRAGPIGATSAAQLMHKASTSPPQPSSAASRQRPSGDELAGRRGCRRELTYLAALANLACGPTAEVAHTETPMTETTSQPNEPKHPGEIVHDDKVDGRTWTVKASEVPETIAWVDVNGVREPVVRIEITGTREQRRITKFGRDGQMLETTIQAPPHRPPPSSPTPTPTPE